MIKRIHVNKQRIAQNKKNGTNNPVITMKMGKRNIYAHSFEILGPSKIVYAEECGMKPLSCGARVYIETEAPVEAGGYTFN